jgi:hypothetical protein
MNQHLVDDRPLPRRRFIQLVGGGAVAAVLPLAGCSSAYPAAAVQAWQAPDDTTDLRRWMLAHGLLAPNPHNRQPWRADLRREAEITLVCDGERLLPETDPFGRQILIGCGAFIELAVIAAAERGHRVTVAPFPEGEPAGGHLFGEHAVARLSVVGDATLERDPLFAQIRRRHTHKGVFDNSREVPASVRQRLQETATNATLRSGFVTEPEAMAGLRRITRDAFETEMLTPRTYLESARLMRIGPGEVAANRDGIALMDRVIRVMAGVGAFDRFEVLQRGSSNHGHAMARWAPFETGSGYFWIASRGNSRAAQLDAGRAYVRAHLQATAAGVDMHPLSQALQEFAEVRPQYNALRRQLGIADASVTVQMLARVGYGAEPVGPSPRRELVSMIRA